MTCMSPIHNYLERLGPRLSVSFVRWSSRVKRLHQPTHRWKFTFCFMFWLCLGQLLHVLTRYTRACAACSRPTLTTSLLKVQRFSPIFTWCSFLLFPLSVLIDSQRFLMMSTWCSLFFVWWSLNLTDLHVLSIALHRLSCDVQWFKWILTKCKCVFYQNSMIPVDFHLAMIGSLCFSFILYIKFHNGSFPTWASPACHTQGGLGGDDMCPSPG